jgi:hypothetical protein
MQIFAVASDTIKNSFMIRKTFNIPGLPVFGEVHFRAGSSCRVYFNGKLIVGDMNQGSLPLTQLLRPGENVLGAECIGRGTYTLEGLAQVRYIPNRVLHRKE